MHRRIRSGTESITRWAFPQALPRCLWLSFGTFLFIAIISGCAGKPPGEVTGVTHTPAVNQTLSNITVTPSPPTPSPERLAQLIEGGSEIPQGFNPLLPSNAASQRVIDNLYDTLLTVNARTAEIGPRLATSWDMTTDNLTVTFHLRSDVKWHDGQAFTAQDVLFTFETIRRASGAPHLKAKLVDATGFSAPDDQTVVVSFNHPACPLLYTVGQIPILPRHLLAGKMIDDPSLNTHPVGTGPFKFVSRLASGEVHLDRNVEYFGGSPQFAQWIYRPITDTHALVEAVARNEIDVALGVPGATVDSGIPSITQLSFPRAEYFAVILNTVQSTLMDARVRTALALAIDRQRLITETLGGYGSVIDAPILPDHWAYAPPDTQTPYDPTRARQLLAEAGWADTDGDGLLDKHGAPLQLALSVNSENVLRQAIAMHIQRYWLAVGVSAELQVVDFPTLVERLFGHRFDAAVFSWPIHPDPDQTRFWGSDRNTLFTGFNVASYTNTVVADKVLAEGLLIPGCNPQARAKAYRQLITALAADKPYIFLFVPHTVLLTTTHLSGIEPGPYASLSWNIVKWQKES